MAHSLGFSSRCVWYANYWRFFECDGHHTARNSIDDNWLTNNRWVSISWFDHFRISYWGKTRHVIKYGGGFYGEHLCGHHMCSLAVRTDGHFVIEKLCKLYDRDLCVEDS